MAGGQLEVILVVINKIPITSSAPELPLSEFPSQDLGPSKDLVKI